MIKLKEYKQLLESSKKESLDMSIADCHIPGVFSLVFSGTDHGNLTRAFIATKKIKFGDVQFHSHRYGLFLTPIKGVIEHHIAKEDHSGEYMMQVYNYRSPLNGGKGLVYSGEMAFNIKSHYMPIGSTTYLFSKDIHTMSCSKGSVWIVEENGFDVDSSTVLGVPFVLDGLYNTPKQFQVNDMHQLVLRSVRNIVNEMEAIS